MKMLPVPLTSTTGELRKLPGLYCDWKVPAGKRRRTHEHPGDGVQVSVVVSNIQGIGGVVHERSRACV